MSNHGRRGAFAIAATLACALLLPSTALAGHDLVIYKQEAHVDLTADEFSASVSCNPGDHALDGMWRIDHADQDDYVAAIPLITGAVDVTQAEATSDSTYSFTFEKNAIGRAQAKIFVTCLANKTSGDAHQHTFWSSAPPPGSTLAFTKADGSTAGFESTSLPVIDTSTYKWSRSGSCPAGFRLVSPGFRADTFSTGDPNAGQIRLYESISSTGSDWSWKFETSGMAPASTMNLTTSYRCLRIKVSQDSFDKHKLVFKFNHPVTFNPPKNRVSEGQYNCGDHYKAIVAGFSIPDAGSAPSFNSNGDGLIDPPVNNTAFNNVYFLGMDPRPKQRAYRFVNRSTTSTYPVALKALCLNYRTT